MRSIEHEVIINGYTRSSLIKELNNRGYPINSHDVSWATEYGLISPRVIKSNFFVYSGSDLKNMELMGETKARGLDKSVLAKLIETGTIDIVNRIMEEIATNQDLKGN